MSRTLNLTCRQCMKTLWVGQYSRSLGAWYLYGANGERDRLAEFANVHEGHDLRFEDSEKVPMDAEELGNGDDS